MVFGKVKKWLGIEGVKVKLIVAEPLEVIAGQVEGQLQFSSMHPQVVNSIKVKLIEKYIRGKKEEKLIDEYVIGILEENLSLEVLPNETIEIPFTMTVSPQQSEMDKLERKNFAAKGIVKIAKWFRGVKSNYRIEAEATVEGVRLNPLDKKPIKVVFK